MIKKFLLSLCLFAGFFVSAQTTLVDSIISGGIYRNYRLYKPAAYTGTTARPLVLNLHGYTSSAQAQQAYANMDLVADTANFLIVYPNGTLLSGQPFWNAGISPTYVNDIQFIDDLINHLVATNNIDVNSIYSCGMSNGGFMSHTLACGLSNKIAAIASVTGSMFASQRATCSSNRAVPVMQISGTADGTVPYAGNGSTMLPIDTVVSYWVNNNNCYLVPITTNVPNTSLTDGCTAINYLYNGGNYGSTVELYKIVGGGHTWPNSPFTVGVTNHDFDASSEIWRFFRKYKLNQFASIEAVEKIHFSVYPNPMQDDLILQFENTNNFSVKIYNVTGEILISQKANSSSISLNTRTLAEGIYFVEVSDGINSVVKKLVK